MNEKNRWDVTGILETAREYQSAAVLVAAAELDVFARLQARRSAEDLARELGCNERGLRILLDALTSMKLLHKAGENYTLQEGLAELLTEQGSGSVLGMLRHQANCLRSWGELALVVKQGKRAEKRPSVRGREGDIESFIEAMHNVSAPEAGKVIQGIQPLSFDKLLDIGCASGTWTMAFLSVCREGRAVLFDLPQVIPLARKRLSEAGFLSRVDLVEGDYNADAFPGGCDLAWLSAIVHQNSMEENRELFLRTYRSLRPGGRIAIRDIVMEEDRVAPPSGAFFAINMLVNTEGGGTYTFSEMKQALETAGFSDVQLAQRDPGMQSIIVAAKV